MTERLSEKFEDLLSSMNGRRKRTKKSRRSKGSRKGKIINVIIIFESIKVNYFFQFLKTMILVLMKKIL